MLFFKDCLTITTILLMLCSGSLFAQARVVICASGNNEYQHCAVDTNGGVMLKKTLSDVPCYRGKNWDFDKKGIWVDRGCRGEFTVGLTNIPPPAVTLVCASGNGAYRFCPADTSAGVKMLKQLSSAACQKDRSWGYDNRGIWVDKGCRAKFSTGVEANNQSSVHSKPEERVKTVVCASDDGRQQICPTIIRDGSVTLSRQLSDAECKQGYSWGYDQESIWVNRGCRAEFTINYTVSNNRAPRGGYRIPTEGIARRPGSQNQRSQSIVCASENNAYNYCKLPGAERGVVMLRQLSDADCRDGYSWGYDNQGVWVNRGCRAEFSLR